MSSVRSESLEPRRLLAAFGTLGDGASYEVRNERLVLYVSKPSSIAIHARAGTNGLMPAVRIGQAGGPPADERFRGIRSIEIHGSAGDDHVRLSGAIRPLVAYLGDGDDQLSTSAQMLADCTAYGESGDDLLVGTIAADAGYDPAPMYFDGGSGDDTLRSGAGNDRLAGGLGNDLLNSGAGRDTLGGGAGKDVLDGGNGIDKLDGGPGIDRIAYRPNDKLSKDRHDHVTLLS